MLIERWSVLDALFMTVITVTTIGYQEVHRLTPAGQVFTIVLIFVGVGIVLYTIGELFGWFLAIDWPQRQRRRRMERTLARLTDHFIICGYGRVGRRIADVFRQEQTEFVVIDVNQESLTAAEADGLLTVHGNAGADEVLKRAGIERARGLIAAVDSDADNLYVVLSARVLRPDLLIVARASSEDAITKLERAGATHALSPYYIAGQRLAMLAVRPTAVQLVETLLGSGEQRLVLEEVTVEPDSGLAGTRLGDLRHRLSTGAMIVALSHDGALTHQPSDDHCLQPGDGLFLVGSPDRLRQIEKLS